MAKPPFNLPSPNLADAMMMSFYVQDFIQGSWSQPIELPRELHLMLNRDDILGIIGSEIDGCERTDEIVAPKKLRPTLLRG